MFKRKYGLYQNSNTKKFKKPGNKVGMYSRLPRTILSPGYRSGPGLRSGGWVNPSSRGELKYLDFTIGNGAYAISGAGTLQCINLCIQGADAINRIGRQIRIKSIYYRNNVYSSPTMTSTGQIRTMIVLDKEPNGVAMTAVQLLVSDQLGSLNLLDNRSRFKVIHDRVQTIAGIASTTSQGGTPTSVHEEYYKKCDILVQYNGVNGGTIADIATNSLWFITYENGLATVPPSNLTRVRIRFTDV